MTKLNDSLRNHCNILWVDGGIHPKNRGKTASCAKRMLHKFSLRFWGGYLHHPNKILQRFLIISFRKLLNANFDFDVSVANDVAIAVAKWALLGKVMQGSPCPEVSTLTNENGRNIMKLNYMLLPPTVMWWAWSGRTLRSRGTSWSLKSTRTRTSSTPSRTGFSSFCSNRRETSWIMKNSSTLSTSLRYSNINVILMTTLNFGLKWNTVKIRLSGHVCSRSIFPD